MELSEMTRAQLLAECKKRQLSGAGSNEELIARIEAHEAAQADQDPMLGEVDEPADESTDEPTEPAEPIEPTEEPVNIAEVDETGERAEKVEASDADSRNVTVEGGDPDPVKPDPDPNTGYVNGQYRVELPLGDRAIDDAYHAHLIREAHTHAELAGYKTRGGGTVGHRLRYSADASGRRTVVYVVYVQNPDKPKGLRRP
jgi:hypothetical protein